MDQAEIPLIVLCRFPRPALFTPTSCSWLNAVEGFFAKLAKRLLNRGVFRWVVDLQAAIDRFVAGTNHDPQAVHMDRRPRPNHRLCQTRAPNVRFDPLAIVWRHRRGRKSPLLLST